MSPHRSAVLLSVKPRFADAITSGTKTVELRRRGLDARPGATVVLYASAPTMAIVGTAQLCEVLSLPHPEAWRRFQDALGVSRKEFDAYLDGSATAVLLRLTCPQRLDRPITLQQLRSAAGSFWPPQSYRYVSAGDPAPLRRLATTP